MWIIHLSCDLTPLEPWLWWFLLHRQTIHRNRTSGVSKICRQVFLHTSSPRTRHGIKCSWWTFHTFELLICRPCRPLSLVLSMDDQTHQDHFKGLTLSPTRSDSPGMSWNLSDAEKWLKNKWQSNPSSILIILSIISLSAGPPWYPLQPLPRLPMPKKL